MNHFGLLRIEEVRLSPGDEWMDTAGGWRFVRVVSGAAYWLGALRKRALTEGELMVVPPMADGVVRASQISEVLLQGFGFGHDLLRGLLTPAERRFFENQDGPCQVQFLPSTHSVTQRFVALAAGTGRQGELSRRAEALCLIAEVLDEQMTPHFPRQTPGQDASHRFEQLMAQMPQAELIQATVAGLARLCGCSPRHFSRLFQRRFGDSVRVRQTELRLLKAQSLLGTTGEKISDIALASGYRNVSLFNLLFKRRFGITPSECREQVRTAGLTTQGKSIAP